MTKRTPTYTAWGNMIQRCCNPKNPRFKDYGGRGITVCERWKSFQNFLTDMGERPNSLMSIDREDVEGNYTPNNCQWAWPDQQVKNRRPYLKGSERGYAILGQLGFAT